MGTGGPVLVVGAGGIYDGSGLASALAVGCSGVWVGTRFIAADEAGAGPLHKKKVVNSDYSDTMRTTLYTGRPMRIFKTPYALEWEEKRRDEMLEMQTAGIPAWVKDCDPEVFVGANPSSVGTLHLSEVLTMEEKKNGVTLTAVEKMQRGVFLTGQCAGAITEVLPAAKIVEEMVATATEQLRVANTFV